MKFFNLFFVIAVVLAYMQSTTCSLIGTGGKPSAPSQSSGDQSANADSSLINLDVL